MILSNRVPPAILLLASFVATSATRKSSKKSYGGRVSFTEHVKYASTRIILGSPPGHCHNISDLDNPTIISVHQGLWRLMEYSVGCDEIVRDRDEIPSTSSIIYPTEAVVLNDRRPICSFQLSGHKSNSSRGGAKEKLEVTFLRRNNSTRRGSYAAQVLSHATECVSLCGSSLSPAWLPYSHTVQLKTEGRLTLTSESSIKIFSDRWCQELIQSDVGSGASLISISRRGRESIVRSIRFQKIRLVKMRGRHQD